MKSLLEIITPDTESFYRSSLTGVIFSVENSISKALDSKGDNECSIVVRFTKENDECYVQVLESFMKHEHNKKTNIEKNESPCREAQWSTTPKKVKLNKGVFEGMVPVIRHNRIYEFDEFDDITVASKGGATFTFRLDYKNSKVYFGMALCSMKDNFNKRIGREMADLYLHRFAESFPLDREKLQRQSLVSLLMEYLDNKEETSEFEKKVLSFMNENGCF